MARDPEKIKAAQARWRARNPDYHAKWRAANRERYNELQREWRRKNPEKALSIWRKHHAANREARNAASREWHNVHYERTISRLLEYQRANPDKVRQWRKAHREKHKDALRAKAAERRAKISSKEDCEYIYILAGYLSLDVDHIRPLKPCRICGIRGIHEPRNLQLLPHRANSAKRNRCHECWMKTMSERVKAHLRADLASTRNDLLALWRVGHAVGFDLFRWADGQE